MVNRWHMNRIGFVNFWLYDEETFSFSDGKLLLRGQNGSGKSITTQSFIPFILDGDRTPSRLDPFGSGDRRMEYYFLGESKKEESTGYLFLEFKREHVEQYRTIGIGQRAKKGKPMDFWGFLIQDGRRIGYDMNLYREVGAKKIPYSKQELKNRLGEENPFTEFQKEYMEMVNKYMFGFSSPEQYAQFIRLLIQVRAPKLSKEFKPTKVYEILNDSLQILSEEDLRAMVEAMEKMDEIQGTLENLKSAYGDLKSIRSEYIRYNHYMLGKKAQAYVEETNRTDSIRKSLGQKKKEQEQIQSKIRHSQEQVKELEEEIRLLEIEIQSLHMDSLEASVDKLHQASKEKEEAEKEKKQLEDKIEERRGQIRIYQGMLHTSTKEIQTCQNLLEKIMQRLEKENKQLVFAMHEEIKNLKDSPEKRMKKKEIHSGLKQLEEKVNQGYEALGEWKETQKMWDREEEKLQECLIAKQNAEAQLNTAKEMEHECRDKIIEGFYVQVSNNEELTITRDYLDELTRFAQQYTGPEEISQIRDSFYQLWEKKNQILSTLQWRTQEEKRRILEEKERIVRELEQLEKDKDPKPERNKRVLETRKILKEKGISFLSFYEAVEFTEGTEEKRKDQIESQLADAGILDALVISDKEYDRAKKELKGRSDCFIQVIGKRGERFPYFTVSDIKPGLREKTEEILSHFWEEKAEGASFVLSKDGYFKHGILEGYSNPEGEASYIGAAARKRKKERMIQEKKQELAEKEESYAALEELCRQIEQRTKKLKQEYENFPTFADLDQAILLVKGCKETMEQWKEKEKEQEETALLLKEKSKLCEQQVIKKCKQLPYLRNQKTYEEIKACISSYLEGFGELEHILFDWDLEKEKYHHTEELLLKEEDTMDGDFSYLNRVVRTIRERKTQIQAIEEYLNDPKVREMAQKLDRMKNELIQKRTKMQQHREQLAGDKSHVEILSNDLESLENELKKFSEKETMLEGYFAEELALGYVRKPDSGSIYETAVEVFQQMKEGEKKRSGIEVTTSLLKVFQSHIGTLSSYGACMEECFEDSADSSYCGQDRELLQPGMEKSFIWKSFIR